MTNPRPTVLILDDSPEDTEAFQRALREDFQVLTAATGAQGRALIAAQPPDCLLLDYMLPDLTAVEFLAARDPAQVDAYAVIVLTGHAEVALAVDCMKHGAHDFLTKGRFRGDELRRAVTQGIEKLALRRQVATQQQALERAFATLQASEARLQASEALLRLALAAARQGIFDWDIATNRLTWTRQHEVLFDFKPGEFDGTYAAFASRVHPQDLPGVDVELTRCIAAREPLDCEYRVIWRDGSQHWIAARGEFVFNATGQPLRMRGVVMEVTQRKQAELELCRYRQVVETAGEMLLFIDRELRFGIVNPAYAQQFQRPPADFVGRRIEEMLKPDAYALVAAHLELTLAGQPQQFSLQSPHRDGQTRDLEITQQPFWMDGEVQGVVVSLHDVTALREIQRTLEAERACLEERVTARTAALQASETKLRSIYDLLPVGLTITNPAGQIIDCNRASETLLGLSREAQFQRTYDGPEWTIVRPDGTPMPPEEYASVRALAEHQTVRDVELGIVKPEGLTWISVSAMPATHPDYGVVIAYVDITRRKQAEIAMSESQNLLLTVIDTAPIRVFWKDRNLRYLGCNRAFAMDAGMAHSHDVIGKDDCQLSWAAQAERYRADDRSVMASGIPKLSYDEPQTTPSGQTMWLRTSKVVLRDRDHAVFGLLGIYEDVTERKQVEAALQASEAKARAIIDASPVPFAIAHETGAVSYLNAAFTETFGYI
ncbi:PAS domain S-box protein [uncultured Thiodictyon sp.]|uniref:PAS domain S-box protein n=1 Tax=uncultured Thiodictyon sp. TaxID=1846217 RepID=UPI0025F85EE3|nr:PAS domain S-box protein [uncultured Thiodictyon sp.]